MSMKMRASSGTYNVRASEQARDTRVPPIKTVRCVVHFLDDTEISVEVDKRAKAQVLLDKVFEHLELIEKDYFGLQFADIVPAPDAMSSVPVLEPSHCDLMRWLDAMKTLKKQIKVSPPYKFYFRVKFYVTDPSRLQEEYTRYHFFLQLKKDILEGRLMVPYKTAVMLTSYAVQSEFGDYNPEEHVDYLSEIRFIPNQPEDFEREVIELHKQHRGLSPADVEMEYLEVAGRLEQYGVDLYPATWDQSNMEIQLGVTSAGLVVFQGSVRVNTFSWAKIVKISFKRKQFFIQLRRELNDTLDNLIGFNMVSYRSCKNLWKSCVEHHTFFRLHTPKLPAKKSFFSLGSKFSGRTEFQTIEDGKKRARIERSFTRSPSKRYARRTVGGTTRDVILEERSAIDGYRNMPQTNNSQSDGYLHSPPGSNRSSPLRAVTPSRGNGVASQHIPNSTSYPNSLTRPNYNDPGGGVSNGRTNTITATIRATLPTDYKPMESRKAWTDNKNDDDGGGFLSRTMDNKETSSGFVPSIQSKTIGYIDEDNTTTEQTYELPAYNESYVPNGNTFQDSHSLVTIRMRPDSKGRFGFNVKGGADQGMPIIVSRVAPQTPADLCIPRLNEGDQVLFINGRDVSQHTHEQVVMFIRASRETHSGELEIIVRPNAVYNGDESEEPDFQFIPDPHLSNISNGNNTLQGSMKLLRDYLDNGTAMAQFEQLYRKKTGFTMNHAKMSENISKNRYRDISPYDQTRVHLKNADGDYINANFVNMEIPGAGIVNRYIAAQGPLPNTCGDFWEMIWEQQCRLVVMLTTKVERGRVKCHQYWPDLYETMDFGQVQVTCLKEDLSNSFAFREFTLVSTEGNEERHIRQMQYIAWPDHGVPETSSDFLDFVTEVREKRTGMVEPTVVHCSAGIGRTGVIITMETAQCLIEANQPVYPLEIVRQMRDQRAMLIQTSSQYKFVCEAIYKVFNDKLVKPLDDYQR